MSIEDRVERLRDRARTLGVEVDSTACARLLGYLDAMLGRNRELNLTAIRDTDRAEVLHALDSLALGLAGVDVRRALDLGSGNGFPGVAALALWPEAELTLMERTAKKARALESLLSESGLAKACVAHVDAAQAPSRRPELRRAFDLVTVRAVGRPNEVAQLAAPLTRPGGHLVLWLDHDASPDVDTRTGFEGVRTVTYELPEPAPRIRVLAVYRRAR